MREHVEASRGTTQGAMSEIVDLRVSQLLNRNHWKMNLGCVDGSVDMGHGTG